MFNLQHFSHHVKYLINRPHSSPTQHNSPTTDNTGMFYTYTYVLILVHIHCYQSVQIRTGLFIHTAHLHYVENSTIYQCKIQHDISITTDNIIKRALSLSNRLDTYNLDLLKVGNDKRISPIAFIYSLIKKNFRLIKKQLKLRQNFKTADKISDKQYKCSIKYDIISKATDIVANTVYGVEEVEKINDEEKIDKNFNRSNTNFFTVVNILENMNSQLRSLRKLLQVERTCVYDIMKKNELCTKYMELINYEFGKREFLIKKWSPIQHTEGLSVDLEILAYKKENMMLVDKLECLTLETSKMEDENLFFNHNTKEIGYYKCKEKDRSTMYQCDITPLANSCQQSILEEDIKKIVKDCEFNTHSTFSPITSAKGSTIYRNIQKIDEIENETEFHTFTEIFLNSPSDIYTEDGKFVNEGMNKLTDIGFDIIKRDEYKELADELMTNWEYFQSIPYLSQISTSAAFSLMFITIYCIVVYYRKRNKHKNKRKKKRTLQTELKESPLKKYLNSYSAP